MRTLLKAPVNPSTGYGKDGLGLIRGFMELGHSLTVLPTYVYPPLPDYAAMALTAYSPGPYDLIVHHDAPDALGLPDSLVRKGEFSVAATMWEFSSFRDNKKTDEIRQRLSMYDLVLAYDRTSYKALSTAVEEERLRLWQGGYNADFWTPSEEDASRDWYSDEFVVTQVGQLTPRKDPYVTATAVAELREEGLNIKLVLKNLNEELHPSFIDYCVDNGIVLIDRLWTDAELKTLFLGTHVYVAPSWGEGLNLPALEAGTTGCALLLSPCGGHLEWGSSVATFLEADPCLYFDMEHVKVRKESVKQHLRAMYEDRAQTRLKGSLAARTLPASMGWEPKMHALMRTIKEAMREK